MELIDEVIDSFDTHDKETTTISGKNVVQPNEIQLEQQIGTNMDVPTREEAAARELCKLPPPLYSESTDVKKGPSNTHTKRSPCFASVPECLYCLCNGEDVKVDMEGNIWVVLEMAYYTIKSLRIHSLTKEQSPSLLKLRGMIENIRSRMDPIFRQHPGSEACIVCSYHSGDMWEYSTKEEFSSAVLQANMVLQFHQPPLRPKPEFYSVERVEIIKKVSNGLVQLELRELGRPQYIRDATNSQIFRQLFSKHPKDCGMFVQIKQHANLGSSLEVPPKFNIDQAKEWLSKCDKEHVNLCQSAKSHNHPDNLILIDTNRWCIAVVDRVETIKYAALSYVWGHIRQSELTEDHLSEWRTEGIIKSLDVPSTIKDAITLCSNIGIQYLWVDSLCIIHDDTGIRHDQLSQMYLIYHHAELMIVAAHSDHCDDGLPGVSNFKSRYHTRAVWDLPCGKVAKVPAYPNYILQSSTWRTRGWTFQEELCSKRALIFLPNIILFSCLESIWREDLCLENPGTIGVPNGALASIYSVIDRNVEPEAAIKLFRDLVKQYLARTLTHDKDIEYAFAGVAGLVESIIGSLYHGVGERYFGEIIEGCWFWDSNVDQRVGFPTWSWTGWKYTPDHSDCAITPLSSRIETPLLKFFKFSSVLEPLYRDTEAIHEHFLPDQDELSLKHDHFLTKLEDSQSPILDCIAFFTSYAMLRVEPVSGNWFRSDGSVHEFRVVDPETRRRLTTISLRDNFVQRSARVLPFIAIAYSSETKSFRIMLIREQDGIAYKVNVTVSGRPVKEEYWWAVNPVKRLIVMG
jgi:hypothetical protein